ncbi:hypothetical protein [Gorillibacterium sp. sgz500922]|uniref:hypothetical protein n=1 Tax=Gorillibacterium sp. sgz500922 TaxID=3446694 RepID=UPI003F671D33
MATVSTTLKLFDQFSSTLTHANQAMDTVIQTAGRVKQALQGQISINIDVNHAIAQLDQIRMRMSTMGTQALRIVVDANDITRQLAQIRARAGTTAIRIVLNPGSVIAQAAAIRNQVKAELRDITVRINIRPPQQVMAFFTHLHTAIQQLTTAVMQLTASMGSLLQGAQHANQLLIAQLNQILQQIRQIGPAQRGAGNAGRSGLEGMLGTVKQLAGAYIGLNAAKRLFESSVGEGMKQQQIIDTLSARSGSEGLGNAIFDQVSKQALKYGQSVSDALSGTMSFMSNTMDPQKLAQLNTLASRLSKLNPEEGIKGAAFSLKELMSGDYTSIAERFNMSRTMLQNSAARKAGQAGDVDGFIKGMDELLNKQNMTQQAFEKMLDSPAAKWQRIINQFKFSMASAGRKAIAALSPLIDTWGKIFDSGKFDSFFNGLAGGLRGIANVSSQVTKWMSDHWNVVQNVLLAVGLTAAGAAAMFLIDWLVAAWPIFLIIGAIAGLLTILNHFGISTGEVVASVVGYFGFLKVYFENMVITLQNTWAAWGDFFHNFFIDPVFAVKKLFYDLAFGALENFYQMSRGVEEFASGFTKRIGGAVNHVLSNFQGLVHALGKIPGFGDLKDVSIQLVDTTDQHGISNWIKGIQSQLEMPTSQADGIRNTPRKANKTAEDYVSAFDKAYQGTKDTLAGVGEGLKNASAMYKNGIPSVGTVGTVNKIKDTVDISSEDLKVMRDLAEMKSIQNFISLTPTVQITTGDIRHEVDVNEMLRKIEDTMQREIATSARGAYGL